MGLLMSLSVFGPSLMGCLREETCCGESPSLKDVSLKKYKDKGLDAKTKVG